MSFGLYEHASEEYLGSIWPTFHSIIQGHHIGCPVLSKRIEQRLSIQGSVVRDLINYGLTQNIIICSGPKGYFLPSNRAQAQEALNHLISRMHALETRIHLTQDLISKMPTELSMSSIDTEDDLGEVGEYDSITDSIQPYYSSRVRIVEASSPFKLDDDILNGIWSDLRQDEGGF
jgi:hypothetical protein